MTFPLAATAPRTIRGTSSVSEAGVAMALAPALTPTGLTAAPSFFHGFSTHPRALAQGLVTLADITASRYFQFAPSNMRDPVLTAHGDRLRAEVFSADNCVYARLDILDSGLDGGDIGYGTTNVDIGSQMRQTLSLVNTADLLHLDVGVDGMTAATLESTATERPVTMPDRWIRGLGNAAQLHRDLVPRFSLTPAQARSFIAQLPSISAGGKRGWLVPTPSGVRIAQRKTADAVWIDGLNRLTALKRLVTLQTGMVVFGPADDSAGPAAVAAQLPNANLLLALTNSHTTQTESNPCRRSQTCHPATRTFGPPSTCSQTGQTRGCHANMPHPQHYASSPTPPCPPHNYSIPSAKTQQTSTQPSSRGRTECSTPALPRHHSSAGAVISTHPGQRESRTAGNRKARG